MLAHTSGLRVQDYVDAAAMLATGSARMRLCSLIRALRATQCQISRLEDAMFAVVEHVILLRLTSPGNGWKQKCLPAPQIQAWLFQNRNFRKRSETHYTRLNVWSAISKQKRKPALPDKRLRLSGDRAELSIWPMIFHPLKFTRPAHLPKIGFKSGKISERYRWACARAPRSRPEWASIGMIASTPTWR